MKQAERGHLEAQIKERYLLKKLGYSLQSNKKRLEGQQHPDRNAQFENIAEKVRRQHGKGDPAISVDPEAGSLLISADGGGSNGYRLRLWKFELQKLADDLGFPISVSHLPPGTSKWNKIEHRLFSFITKNGYPRTGHACTCHEGVFHLSRLS